MRRATGNGEPIRVDHDSDHTEPRCHVPAAVNAWRRSHDSLIVIVAHGNIIRSVVSRAIGLDPKRWLNLSIANCSLSVLEVHPEGRIRLVSFGDMGHLPVALQGYPAPAWDPGLAPKAR